MNVTRLVGSTCMCRCADDFEGVFCQLPPAYIVSNQTEYSGRYERLSTAECNGKPVYQLGGEGGVVLFQPTDRSFWMVGPSSRKDCGLGALLSSGFGSHCPLSPDGAGCAGAWTEWDGDDFQPRAALSVAAGRWGQRARGP